MPAAARAARRRSRCRSSSSLHGVDVLPYDDPLRVGMIGSYGNRWANQAIGRADLLLVLGSRLDIRQTGADTTLLQGRPDDLPRRLRAGRDQPPGRRLPRRASETCARSSRPSSRACASRSRGPSGSEELDEARARWPDTDELARDRRHQPERAHARALRGLGRRRRVRRRRRPAPDVGGAVARALRDASAS